jgi:hypothetical protein
MCLTATRKPAQYASLKAQLCFQNTSTQQTSQATRNKMHHMLHLHSLMHSRQPGGDQLHDQYEQPARSFTLDKIGQTHMLCTTIYQSCTIT